MKRIAVALVAVGLLCVPVARADSANIQDTFKEGASIAQAEGAGRLEAVGINEVIHIHNLMGNHYYSIVRMTVADYGCTVAEDFKVHLLPRHGETWVYVERLQPDECRVEGEQPRALRIEINVDSTPTVMLAPHRILNPLFWTWIDAS